MDNFRGPDSSPGCATCPCAVNGMPVRPIRGAGALNSLAIVSDAPATEDASQGWPMVGASGKLLQQALSATGIDRHSIWITNAILCQKPREPSALSQAIDCCRPRLANELLLVAPTAIAALGTDSALALQLPVQALKQARGTLQKSTLGGDASVVTTIHPSSILAGGGAGTTSDAKSKMNVDAQYVFLESDLSKAYSLAVNPLQPLWQDDIEVFPVSTDEACAKVMMLCDYAKLLSIDLEWGMDDKITWLGVGTAEKAYSIYYPHANQYMRAILKRAGQLSVPKLFHNLQADVPIWEAQIGPLAGTFEDTMLMHHAAYPGAAHDLQNVASQFLLVPPWKADRKNEEKGAAKASATEKRSAAKSAKALAHAERNAASAGMAKERKAKRIAKHNEKNTTAHFLKLLGE